MKLNKYLLICFITLFNSLVYSQKKQIDHTVYDSWKSIKNSSLSENGNFVNFEINPHRGDGQLFIYNVEKGKHTVFDRASTGKFTNNEELFAFVINPGFDTLRQLELKKVKKDKWVKDSLGIYWVQKDSLVKYPNLVKLEVAEKGNYIGYTLLADSLNVKTKSKKKKKSKKPVEKCESKGNTLFILDSKTNQLKSFPQVTQFEFNKNGNSLYFISHFKEKKEDKYRIHQYLLEMKKHLMYDTIFNDISSITYSKKGNQLAFMATQDTAKETRLYDVFVWGDEENPKKIIGELPNHTPNTPSPKSELKFSLDENRLYFGLYPIPEKKEKDTLLDSEKAELDIWHYKDKRLQPYQLKQLDREKNKSFLSCYDLHKNSLVQLEKDTLSISLLDQGNSNYALASSNQRYEGSYNWTMPWPSDYYRINVKTGETELIKENVGYSEGISPDGQYFVYFDSPNNQFYSIDLNQKTEKCMTCSDSINWQSDINGMPFDADPIGTLGYLNENEILLYSEYDIWKYNFKQNKLSSITDRKGEKLNVKYRIIRLNQKDSTYIDLDNAFIKGINQDTFDETILSYNSKSNSLTELYSTDHRISGIVKSTNGEKIIFRQMNVTDFPDVHLTTLAFKTPQKISKANPQQSEYIWPTVEPIQWTSYNGEELKGLLYKPEDFDANKSYPLMVYFYELYSDRIHNHYTPRPTASIIFPTEYTSAGYIVFIPDIRYTPGHPGRDAYNSIMSGTDKVLELYPNIDSTRMALQGQSWGGYQTAQLITLTDRYKAAMAGAPVSNMFSAYGGIRWGSGLNRQFQYEYTQSRIGGTIWEVPELYRENSPLFGVPNIKTPLLIMHNDNDGAVPWYQGIELFTAMMRMDKKVWMLQYNKEEHNLMQDRNRKDLSIRMRQFFDHYLLDKPAPEWLEKGIKAIDKGKNYGLE